MTKHRLSASFVAGLALLSLAAGCSGEPKTVGPNCSVPSTPDAGDYYDAGICRGALPCCPATPPDCSSGGPYPACVRDGATTYTCACCADLGWSCWGGS